ncbi:ABC transporter permease [Candidatus Margulisiibacteriota bacterium]
MDLIEIGKTAVASLTANKLRSSLMLLGVVIGVAAVIIVVAIGTAGQKRIERELETFGVNSIWIWRDWENRADSNENFVSSNNEITNDDVKAITAQTSLVRHVTPCYFDFSEISYERETKRVRLLGTIHNYLYSNNETPLAGRFLTELDVAKQRRVAVLSEGLKQDLFKNVNPVGKSVRINNEKFIIVGVLEKKDRAILETIHAVGSQGGDDVYLPISVMQHWYGTKNVSYLQAHAVKQNSRLVLEQLKDVLNRRHRRPIEFTTESMQKYLETSRTILGILSLVFGLIASISLLVGGLGIMNIMLISVTERTREIGIRKAVGATEKDIVSQFLTESALISLVGGSIGIFLGVAGVFIAGQLAGVGNIFSWQPIVIAFGTSALVGILAGLYPANYAANLDPIAALRYE